MSELQLKEMIEKSWDNRDKINTTTTGEIKSSVEKTLKMLSLWQRAQSNGLPNLSKGEKELANQEVVGRTKEETSGKGCYT